MSTRAAPSYKSSTYNLSPRLKRLRAREETANGGGKKKPQKIMLVYIITFYILHSYVYMVRRENRHTCLSANLVSTKIKC